MIVEGRFERPFFLRLFWVFFDKHIFDDMYLSTRLFP